MRRLLTILLLCLPLAVLAQINIWEHTACRKKVTLYPYVLQGKDHRAVIVCPGGSYFWHDMEVEGACVAKWLNENGITAFVLRYRTAYTPAFLLHHRALFRGNRYPDPQDDLRQALRLVRERAEEFGINPHQVGAMGFSAGGHLVMSAAELFCPADRPDFVAPIYPVVTFTEDCMHRRSRRGLLGDNKRKDEKLTDLLSLERHVPADCPPVFLMNCKDDPIVDYRNSELLDSALTAQHIPHRYVQYETGGHGFGASDMKGSEECRTWKERFLTWMNKRFDDENR